MTTSPDADGDSDLHTRIRQQEVIAELGQQALETDDLDQLMHDAAAAVTETLNVEYTKVLELLPDGDEVFLRQGVGWQDGLVGSAAVPADLDSQAGYTLLSEEPVIVADLRTEDRFSGPDLLTNHDVVSGINVIIGSVNDPWGVLGTHTTEKREFTETDANFVKSVANVLATAIENEAAHEELREIHERITNGVLALNKEWEFTHVNQQAAEILGYDADELLGANIWETFPTVVGTEFEERYRNAMETQESVSFEGYYPPFDAWFEEHVYPSKTGLSVYFRDITDQKQLEVELEEIYGRISDAVFALDEEWNFTYLNDRAHELINPEGKELVSENIWKEFSAGLSRQFKPKYERAMYEQETVSFEEYYPDPLDSWFEVRAYPSESGLSVYFRDITDRKEREQDLELFRTLLDEINDSVLVIDPHTGEFLDVNETACRRLGYDRSDLLELSVPDMERRFDDIEEWRSHVEDVKDEDAVTIEGVHERKDGTTYPAEVNVTHVELDREYMVGIARDITERKKRERELTESNERLEQFAYAASHDLQEPLRMVSSYLQLIKNRYADDLDEDGEEFLEFAVDGAERMSDMINALLEYSRVETRGDPFEPMDLDAVLDDVLEDLHLSIQEHDAEITAEKLPCVEGDASQVRQVFQNLLSNAIEYSGDEPPQVRIEADRRGGKWLISVHDNGVGISPDDQDRVFEVFQRLHTHEEHSGTGIGLALCQRIVERHGGEIWVDSEPGDGSTFSFTLPAIDES